MLFLKSSLAISEIASHAVWLWALNSASELQAKISSSTGHFRVPKALTFKMRPGALPFLWKWVLFAWEWKIIFISKAEHLTSFWYRGPGELGNGLLATLRLCGRPGRRWMSSALWDCFGGRIFNMVATSSSKQSHNTLWQPSQTGLPRNLKVADRVFSDDVTRPCWCPNPVLWAVNSFVMQTPSFVAINLRTCWPREWKRSINLHKSVDRKEDGG